MLGAIGLWLGLFTATGAESSTNGLREKVAGMTQFEKYQLKKRERKLTKKQKAKERKEE